MKNTYNKGTNRLKEWAKHLRADKKKQANKRHRKNGKLEIKNNQ